MHVLAGLRKGDSISISRESLPGAVLFPGIKYKEWKPEETEVKAVKENKEENDVDNSEESVSPTKTKESNGNESQSNPLEPSSPISSHSHPPSQVHRFLVVTRERFIVLDSGGSGIGSTAIVKSNHHLTEVRQCQSLILSHCQIVEYNISNGRVIP